MIAKVMNQTLNSFAGLGVVIHDTLAEYEALTDAEKKDGNVHLVLEEEPINANIVKYTDDKTVKDELDDLASDLGDKSDASDVTGANAFAKIHQLNVDLTKIILGANVKSVEVLPFDYSNTDLGTEFRVRLNSGNSIGYYGYNIRINVGAKLFQVFGMYADGTYNTIPLINHSIA